ncbi:hypothetical protein I3760_05G043900 [Carya illinoinensis]|nr:hypothetical protein I3760_05G043900 [Carya illinoinensis]
MASSNGGGGREEEQLKRLAELSKNLKEGERILAPTRRPDGTLRKPIRIRAGYVPQEEVAIYQSKGTLWKKEMSSQVGPPGYDPELDTKPKSKSVKRNERKKEKRLQVRLSAVYAIIALFVKLYYILAIPLDLGTVLKRKIDSFFNSLFISLSLKAGSTKDRITSWTCQRWNYLLDLP